MKEASKEISGARRAAWLVAIVFVSTTMAMILSWRAPGLSRYASDRLMQARGPITPPDDIVLVVIDETSIARYGRFPWPRTLTARALDSISAAQPKAIGLDVLYTEPTAGADDSALADSIKRAGNVVLAAQLTEVTDQSGISSVSWLRPLPSIENAAAGVGHANVSTEADGEARELSLRKANDRAEALWSIAVETIRVGDGTRATSVRDVPDGVILGIRTVPIEPEVSAPPLSENTNGAVDRLRSDRMAIDYVGPPGSFSHQTFSFADVLDGKVSPQSFRGKYVLIGATAATLGDHVATPFVHAEGSAGEQHGELMPGVEVLANSMNTILRARFYHETPDWLATLLAATVAALVLGSLVIAQGRFESIKHLIVLFGLFAIIIATSYLVFVRWLIVPPLVPVLLSFAIATPLAFLRRTLRTSTDLDARIAELIGANDLLLFSAARPTSGLRSNPAVLIAQLTGSEAVAIYRETGRRQDRYRLVCSEGKTFAPGLTKGDISLVVGGAQSGLDNEKSEATDSETNETTSQKESGSSDSTPRTKQLGLRLGDADHPRGALILRGVPPGTSEDTIRACAEIATSYMTNAVGEKISGPAALATSVLPRGAEWKARTLGVLNRRLLARARFVDRALGAVDDGLLVTDIGGHVVYANPRAAEIFGVTERFLVGGDLFSRLALAEQQGAPDDLDVGRTAQEMLTRLIVGRAPVEREITIGDPARCHYMLRVSLVTTGDEGADEILGLVVALSDITRQHELQEMKTDVMALMTHELLTPLTAIQGMSEVLAQFEVQAYRRREMHQAINDEAKRLSHMITEYMDITRLESGAHPLHMTPVRITPIIERVLLLLDPLAAQRDIRILRQFGSELPMLLADAGLITQALTNLLSNAIKYSPAKTEISVAVRADTTGMVIEVADHGYGISADDLPHIFEKFYRVPSTETVDVPGTGLGLALVREIVELHGGRVTVKSQRGLGSTFSVRLPVRH